METLRSPKHLTGPALGQPSLTFRAWYEAQYGPEGWAALGRIPRLLRQDYLGWYRTVLDLPVTHGTRVVRIAAVGPEGRPLLELAAETVEGARRRTLTARHVVLATGMDGLGRPAVPDAASGIPRDRWRHSTEAIDFAALRGRRLAVVGGGDSGLDAAATALEAGAAAVEVFIRAADFSRVNHWKAFTHPGHAHGFAALSPEDRRRVLDFLKGQRTPPAQGTIARITRFDQIRLHFNSPVTALSTAADGSVAVETAHGGYRADLVVFATGYINDPGCRPELADLAPHIRFWDDGASPDLGPDFSFQEKRPGTWPALGQVHLFTGAALRSLGKLTGDIPGISLGAERLARGIAARLYADDLDGQLRQLRDYREPEVRGDEWSRIRVDH